MASVRRKIKKVKVIVIYDENTILIECSKRSNYIQFVSFAPKTTNLGCAIV